MVVEGIVHYEGVITPGIFLGWTAISIKQLQPAKSLETDNLQLLDQFCAEEGGEIQLFCRFEHTGGKIESQRNIHREEIPNSPAYKKDGKWFVGIQIFEEAHLSPGAD